MDLSARIETLIEPTVRDLGFEIVRVQLSGLKRRRLQIMAERRPESGVGAAMTVDDCAAISRAVSAILDVEDPIAAAYDLEVSSPGIDRPLVRPADFERFAGFEAKVETVRPINGRKRFRGRLLGIDGDTVRLMADDGPKELPYPEIHRAKLIMTDELLAATEESRES